MCVCETLWFMEHMLVASSRNTNAHITRQQTAHSELIQYTQCAPARLVTLDLGNKNRFLCRTRSTLIKIKKLDRKNKNTAIDYLFSSAATSQLNLRLCGMYSPISQRNDFVNGFWFLNQTQPTNNQDLSLHFWLVGHITMCSSRYYRIELNQHLTDFS